MDHIRLGKPYKVSEHKHKQYQRHYELPIDRCVLVPVKRYGDQISCRLHWKDESGEVCAHEELMFSSAYLEALDAMKDFRLYELWEECSSASSLPSS